MRLVPKTLLIVSLFSPAYAEEISVEGVEAETILRWGEIQLSYVQERDNPLHNRTYYLVKFENSLRFCWSDHASTVCEPFED